MTVTLSQKSYNALLDDLERLRKRNIDLEEKLNKEIKLSYEIEGNLYDVSKERDELINDIADIKRKAEAFDEMVKIYNQKNDLPSDEIFMKMGYCISDLERGSDVESD
ncbi:MULTISPECIES: hypothetical protein [unclassified Staphylococcus]|uniref:hypothetical protein n=1 Tax=unclassified Staphylococcus TaxID=91994 RepID=UPI00122E5C4D|nr:MULTISPECIES: hypothetical protein [unclassified Staphylococcus]KAA2274689.1 hypothetical protein F1592_08570 [Staphylococcus sp. GDX7P312P]KAA2278422.1 hypothetical protein F1591_12035 [Staphylococcus sp. GDX7P459A]